MITIHITEQNSTSLGEAPKKKIDMLFNDLSSKSLINKDDNHFLKIKDEMYQYNYNIHNKINTFDIIFNELKIKNINNKYHTILDIYNTNTKEFEKIQNEVDQINKEKDILSKNYSELNLNLSEIQTQINTLQNNTVINNTDIDIDNIQYEIVNNIKISKENIKKIKIDITTILHNIEMSITSFSINDIQQDFYALKLLDMFNLWQTHPNEIYNKLLEIYKSDYDSFWTYGSVIEYNNKNNIKQNILNEINNNIQHYKEYKSQLVYFEIEQLVNEFLLIYVKETIDEFDYIKFDYIKTLEYQKNYDKFIKQYKEYQTDIRDKLKLIINPKEEENFNIYKETIFNLFQDSTSKIRNNIIPHLNTLNDEAFIILSNDYNTFNTLQYTWVYQNQIIQQESTTSIVKELVLKKKEIENKLPFLLLKYKKPNINEMSLTIYEKQLTFLKTQYDILKKRLTDIQKLIKINEVDNMNILNRFEILKTILVNNENDIKDIYDNFDVTFRKTIKQICNNDKSIELNLMYILDNSIDLELTKNPLYQLSNEKYVNKDYYDVLETYYNKIDKLILNSIYINITKLYNHPFLGWKKIIYEQYMLDMNIKKLYTILKKIISTNNIDNNMIFHETITNTKKILDELIVLVNVYHKEMYILNNIDDYNERLIYTAEDDIQNQSLIFIISLETLYNNLKEQIHSTRDKYNTDIQINNYWDMIYQGQGGIK